jgi:hypothetical protein
MLLPKAMSANGLLLPDDEDAMDNNQTNSSDQDDKIIQQLGKVTL